MTISWNAPGATSVSLSIDGPGVYDTYPGATGSVTVNYPCDFQGHGQHTYLLTAKAADGQTATKTFVTRY